MHLIERIRYRYFWQIFPEKHTNSRSYQIFSEKPQISREENVKFQLEKSLMSIVEIFSILFTGNSAKGGM